MTDDYVGRWTPRQAPDRYNVFVPTFAPQYAAMVARGGLPGVSIEDKNRNGVWVPREWLANARVIGNPYVAARKV
jgi:hypothetical protein